jgi:hypothetical protein
VAVKKTARTEIKKVQGKADDKPGMTLRLLAPEMLHYGTATV